MSSSTKSGGGFQESQFHTWGGLEPQRLKGREWNWGTFRQDGDTQVHRMMWDASMGLRNVADVSQAVAIRGGSWGLETSITSVLQEEDLQNQCLISFNVAMNGGTSKLCNLKVTFFQRNFLECDQETKQGKNITCENSKHQTLNREKCSNMRRCNCN